MLKAFFKNDTQCGPVIQYYREGMLFRESNYVKGLVNGEIKTYWPSGKLKAINYYRMGKPMVGLKEYDRDGKLVTDMPKIMVEEVNQVRQLGRILLKVSVSDDADKVEIYSGQLVDGKYFPDYADKLPVIDGTAVFDYPVLKNTPKRRRLSFIAKFRTANGNTTIAQKYYDVVVR